MAKLIYPLPYSKPTHILLNDVEFYSILPDKPLSEFITQKFETPLETAFLNAGNTIEVLRTYIGYYSSYYEVKIGDKIFYGSAYKNGFETREKNFELIIENRIELQLKSTTTNVFSRVGFVPFTNVSDNWIKEPELKVRKSGFGDTFISVPLPQYNATGTDKQLLDRAKEALIIGTQYILKYYGKKFTEPFVKSILFGDETRKGYFEFTRVTEYFLDPRGADDCSYLKFLVIVPESFVLAIDDFTPADLLQERNEIPVDQEVDLNRLGAGNLSNASKFLYVRINDFQEFKNYVELIKKVILHYNDQQNIFLGNFIDNHICLSTIQELKEESEFDLAKEADKFDIFRATIENILNINKVPMTGRSSERNITINKIVFGFDQKFNICYLEVVRNGLSYPLLKSTSELFLRNIEEGGLNSQRTGKLLYTISLDREYTKNLEESDELKRLKETYPYEQWVNIHIVPPPLELSYPEKNMNCIKDVNNKLTEIAGIAATDVKLFNEKVLDKWQKNQPSLQDKLVTEAGTQWDQLKESAEWEDLNNWRTVLRDKFLQEDFRRLLIELIACITNRIDQSSFLGAIQTFSSFFDLIRRALTSTFCNPTFQSILSFISFIKIPRIDTSDPLQELAKGIAKALLQLIADIYSLIIKAIVNFIQYVCQNPISPFNAADDLGLNEAIDNALNNANTADSPEVSNMYDAFGFPSESSVGLDANNVGTGGIGPQTRNRTTAEDKEKIKQFIGDVACITTTAEFCGIMVAGRLPNDLKDYISNILLVKYPEFADVLGVNGVIDRELLVRLLTKVGKALNIFDACVAIEEADPNFLQLFCAEPALVAKEKQALANRDIPPEGIQQILDDVKNKRKKDLEDLLKAVEDKVAKEVPILCSITEDGKPIQGLVNAAKEDPGYTKMFRDNLKSCMSDVSNEFNKDLKDWAENIFIKESPLGNEIAAKLSKISPNDTQGFINTLTESGIIASGSDGFVIGPALLPKNGTVNVNLVVAPNVKKSLEPELFNSTGGKIELKTTMKQYRDQYIATSLTTINAAANNDAKKLIDDTVKKLNASLATLISNITANITYEIEAGNTIDWPYASNSDYFSTNKTSLQNAQVLLKVITYLGAIIQALGDSLGNYYGNLSDLQTQPPGLALPNPQTKTSADEKTKIVPPPTDAPPAPEVQELQLGGPNTLIPPSYPPMNVDQMYVAAGQAFLPFETFVQAFNQHPIFGPIFKYVKDLSTNFNSLLTNLKKIDSGTSDAYKVVSQINASFPDYNINYEFGLKPPSFPALISPGPPTSSLPLGEIIREEINRPIIENDGRIRNYYNLFISQSVHNDDAVPPAETATIEEKQIYYQKTKNKKFLSNSSYELLDKELSDYIVSFAPLDEFKNSPYNSLQEYVFAKWQSKKQQFLPYSYNIWLKDILNNTRQQVLKSSFFKNRPSDKVGFEGSPSIPYTYYLNLIESSAEVDLLACGIDQNILDTDDIVQKTVEEFVENACNFEPPPTNPNKKRKNMNPVEKNSSNAFIKTTIKVYLYDYFLKGIFSLDTIRPAFVYDKTMAEFFALLMESEMKEIGNNYFQQFIDAAQKYYDERTIQKAEDLLLPPNEDITVKRAKLVELIKIEMLEVSKRLGTKIRETDISIRNEENIQRANDQLAVIKNLISQDQLSIEEIIKQQVDNSGFFADFLLQAGINASNYVTTFSTDEINFEKLFYTKYAYPVVVDKITNNDILKNAGSPYAIFSLLRDDEPIVSQFKIDGTLEDRFLFYTKRKTGKQKFTAYDLSLFDDIEGGKNIDFRLFFEFLFPLRKIFSLVMIHNILSNNSRPEMKRAFKASKSKLAGLHMSFLSRPNDQTLKSIPTSVINQQISTGNFNFMGEFGDAFKRFFINAIIDTPRMVIKNSVEGGGDLNGFLASITHTIAKPISLGFRNELPFQTENIPLFMFTPLISGGLTVAGLFVPPLLPGGLTIAYLLTLGWWEKDWFKKNRDQQNIIAEATNNTIKSVNNFLNNTEEIDCEELQKIIDNTFEGKKLANLKKLESIKEIE